MSLLRRLAGRFTWLRPDPAPARAPELWCRPATVLVLRDRRHAAAPVAGWH